MDVFLPKERKYYANVKRQLLIGVFNRFGTFDTILGDYIIYTLEHITPRGRHVLRSCDRKSADKYMHNLSMLNWLGCYLTEIHFPKDEKLFI